MIVSVIIPVYNVEKYLDKCLKSVVNQTYKELEILLVDDGATDSSGKLCDYWAQKDNRIKVIHKSNGGLSDARNVGIDHAKGDYLVFVDSDDYIDCRLIEHLVYLVINSSAEIAMCKFQYAYDDYLEDKSRISKNYEILSGRESVLRRYKNQDVQFVTAWAKIYHKRLFISYRYPYRKYHEDEFLTYKLLYEANNIARSEERLYYYRQRRDSIMGEMKSIHPDLIEAQKCAIIYFENHKDTVLASLAFDCMMALQIELYYQTKGAIEKKKAYSTIEKEYNEGVGKGYLSGDRKIRKLFLVNPIIYKKIIPVLRKIKYIIRRK